MAEKSGSSYDTLVKNIIPSRNSSSTSTSKTNLNNNNNNNKHSTLKTITEVQFKTKSSQIKHQLKLQHNSTTSNTNQHLFVSLLTTTHAVTHGHSCANRSGSRVLPERSTRTQKILVAVLSQQPMNKQKTGTSLCLLTWT
jgi:hypothetical protein